MNESVWGKWWSVLLEHIRVLAREGVTQISTWSGKVSFWYSNYGHVSKVFTEVFTITEQDILFCSAVNWVLVLVAVTPQVSWAKARTRVLAWAVTWIIIRTSCGQQILHRPTFFFSSFFQHPVSSLLLSYFLEAFKRRIPFIWVSRALLSSDC